MKISSPTKPMLLGGTFGLGLLLAVVFFHPAGERREASSPVRAPAAGAASPPSPVTSEAVGARFKAAQELAASGQSAKALAELLWCYDEGMAKSSLYAGTRNSYLLRAIADLGKSHPPALAALQARRAAALQRITEGTISRAGFADFAALNRALHDEARTLVVFDGLRPDDPQRPAAAAAIFGQLVAAGRYADALLGRSYEQMRDQFSGFASQAASAKSADAARAREFELRSASRDVEVLLGAQQFERARTLAAAVLSYDASEKTRALLRQGASRAGHPEFFMEGQAL